MNNTNSDIHMFTSLGEDADLPISSNYGLILESKGYIDITFSNPNELYKYYIYLSAYSEIIYSFEYPLSIYPQNFESMFFFNYLYQYGPDACNIEFTSEKYIP